MPCYHPQDVVRSKRVCHIKSGKPVVYFGKTRLKYLRLWKTFPDHYEPEEFQVPGCKPKCVGCQEDYSRSWAIRAWHHAQMHDDNCFITLTFNDEFLPKELDHRLWQLFMKRFRRKFPQSKISFFMSGEYGSLNFRPHFHACIFGFDFPDRVLFSVRDNVSLYTSETLSSLWSCPKTGKSFGFSSVGDVTFESAAYIARYVAKKVGRAEFLDGRKPEYSKCSLKRPIGKDWLLSFQDSVFPDDAVSLSGGRKAKPPRYYDKILALTDPELSAIIKSRRKEKAKASPDNSPTRLREREDIKKAQLIQLKRSL